jgi:hypothetical protein
VLRALEFDLERGTPRRRGVIQELGELDARGRRNLREHREAWFPPTVLHERQLAPGNADALTQLVEGHPRRIPEVSNSLAERHKIVHEFTIPKESRFFLHKFGSAP